MSSQPSEPKTQYSYSINEENYHGAYDSPMEAAVAGFLEEGKYYYGESISVGENHRPVPENYIDADVVIEHIQVQDAFQSDIAEDWPDWTMGQREELEGYLRAVFIAWMDRHDLRPTFWNVKNVQQITREEAQRYTTEPLEVPKPE